MRFSMRVGSISTPRQARPRHGRGEGLRAAHAAEARGEDPAALPGRPVRASWALRAATKVSKVPCTMPCEPM
jgi:hypothetical protein